MSQRAPLIAGLLLAACSGGDGADAIDAPETDAPMLDAPTDAPTDAPPLDAAPVPNPGFILPTDVTKANVASGAPWTEVGDADWSCLDTPSTDQPSTGTISLTGRVTDWQRGMGVGNAAITAWSTSPGASVGTATSSDDAFTRGDFAMTLGMLPSGTRRYGFTVTAPDSLTTHVLGRYYAPGAAATDDLDVMALATATALPAFIGVERDPAAAIYAGTMVDCQGRRVSNAAAGVSWVPSTFDDAGGNTFYFSAGSTSLPVRHTVSPSMNDDGMFLVMNAPPAGTLHVQVWGFRTPEELAAGTLTLLGEMVAPAQAGGAAIMLVEPRRS